MEKIQQDILQENQTLRERLEELEETLRAIQNREVDALVVSTNEGYEVFTLKGAEHSYRVLVEQMAEGAVTLTEDGTILYANRKFAEMTETSLEKVIGSSIFRFISPADGEIFQAIFEQGKREKSAGNLTLQTEGEKATIPVFISATNLELEEFPGLCMVVTDLTEQKRREEIIASEKLAQYIIDQAADPIIVCDTEGAIVRASRSSHRLCDLNPMYQSFDMVFPLKTRTGQELRFSKNTHGQRGRQESAIYLCEKGLLGVQATLELPDGQTLGLIVSSSPLWTGDNKTIGCVITMTDITNLREEEAKAQRINEELEERVRERTAELAQSNAELEQFAYVASHDLQEPLRMVASYVQLLEYRYSDKLDDDAREFIGFAVDGAVRMQRLIADLLAFSRVSSRGKLFEPIDSRAVLDEVVGTLKLRIEENSADIIYDELPTVLADETQLVQLFQNLIDNAIKFRSQRPPKIHISAKRKGTMWEFAVRDNGIGISPEYLDRIFVIFQRLHTRSKYPGTGIGLAICKRIVERHGGEIRGESTPGEGSTFTFTLPAA